MLKKWTKLTLCIALVFTMLFATAVGAGAADEQKHFNYVISETSSVASSRIMSDFNFEYNIPQPDRVLVATQNPPFDKKNNKGTNLVTTQSLSNAGTYTIAIRTGADLSILGNTIVFDVLGTITIRKVQDPTEFSLAADGAKNATVKVGGTTLSEAYSLGLINVPAVTHTVGKNDVFTLEVTPASNYYINSVSLDGNAIDGTYSNGKYIYDFEAGEAFENYGAECKITVDAKPIFSAETVNYNTKMTTSGQKKNAVIAALSVSSEITDATFTYSAANLSYGAKYLSEDWKSDFNFDASSTSDVLDHSYGQNKVGDATLENIRIEYISSNPDKYGTAASLTVTLNDLRNVASISAATNVEPLYAGTDVSDIVEALFGQITDGTTSVTSYYADTNKTTAYNGLSYSGAIDPQSTEQQTITFKFVGNEVYKLPEGKEEITAQATFTLKHPHTITVDDQADYTLTISTDGGNSYSPLTTYTEIPANAKIRVIAESKTAGLSVTNVYVTNAGIEYDSTNGWYEFATGNAAEAKEYALTAALSDKTQTFFKFNADLKDSIAAAYPVATDTITLNGTSYTGEELAAALCLGVYYNNGSEDVKLADATCSGSITLSLEGDQTLSFSYSGTDGYAALESTSYTVAFKPFESWVKLAGNVGGSAVTLNGNLLASDYISVSDNEDMTVTIDPQDGYYIASVKLGATTDLSVSSLDKTTGSVSFNSGILAYNDIYVTAKEAKLALTGDTINYNTLMDANDPQKSEAKKRVKMLIDAGNSVPGLEVIDNPAGKLEILYYTGNQISGWKALDYSPSTSLAHAFGSQTEEQIQITFTPSNALIPKVTAEVTLKIDDKRIPTVINLNNDSISFVYDVDRTGASVKNDVLAQVKSVTENTPDGKEIGDADDVEVSVSTSGALNVGEHTATITFNETATHSGSSATLKIQITKADAKITVLNQEVEYDKRGTLKEPVSISPSDASFFSFCAGLDMTSGAYIQLNMPDILDQEKLDSIIDSVASWLPDSTKQEIKNTINNTLNNLGGDIPLADLAKRLNEIVKTVEKIESDYNIDLPLGFDISSISQLTSILNEVAQVMPEGMDVTVRLTFGRSIIPNNAGVYLVGGVASDPNYNTTFDQNNLGYLVIKPRTVQHTLAFNVPDENGLYTLGTIADRDLGSHVVNNENLTKTRLHNLFIGVDADGNPVLDITPAAASKADTAAIRKAGTYTQIAFLADLGNEINYATPIIRQITVVPDLVRVQFTQENPVFTYDGTAKSLTAEVFNKDSGAKIGDAANYLTYIYAGIEGDAEGYYGKNKAPSKAGVYTVTAIYNRDNKVYGAAVTTMIIKPSDEATITVTSKTDAVQGDVVNVNSLVTSSPAEAAKTVITAAVNVEGDFSAQGINALMGTINVDFPSRVDELLDKAGVNRSNALSAASLKSKLLDLINTLSSQLDSQLITETVKLIESLPANANLTFKDNVSYDDIGVYMVIGAITDPDYTLKTDVGLIVISPKVTTAELKWNYTDLNGIITRPALAAINLGATAFTADGAKNDGLTERIEYLFLGMKADGTLAAYTDANQLPDNGVYFQLAYILDKEISANVTVVKPIWRMFALAPQDADVAVESKSVPYTGQPQSAKVTVTKRDGSAVVPSALTTVYVGIDTLSGLYNSTTPPTNVGTYAVVATYLEYESSAMARGALLDSLSDIDLSKIKYVGSGVGYLTITPVGEFMVNDTTVEYDGTEKFPEIVIKEGMEYIALVRNESGTELNIIFPASWNVAKSEFTNVQNTKAQVLADLDHNLPAAVKQNQIYAKFVELLNQISFDTLRINGAKPIEIGKYPVIGIAYGPNSGVIVDDGVLTIVAPGTLPDDPTAPIDPDVDDALNGLPQTGDSSNVMLWMALLSVSTAALVIFLKRKANA